MLYRRENGKFTAWDGEESAACAGLFRLGEPSGEPKEGPLEGRLPTGLLESFLAVSSPRYVSHENWAACCLALVDPKGLGERKRRLFWFWQPDCFQLFTEDEALLGQAREVLPGMESAGQFLCWLFQALLRDDTTFLEEMELEIVRLEDELLLDEPKNYTKKIMALRRRLLALNRYYGQLLDVFDGLQANENDFFDEHALRVLKLADDKTGRLYGTVQHLRDAVTQVREAYQSEVDISLNKTMKLFTVLTAIFLPLTLAAGWYGMNFDMPEYHSPLGYPILIGASVLLVAGTIFAFQRKKWF